MMIVPRGVIFKLIGRRSAIAPAGPIPGRTPTSVPSKTPKKQKRRFIGRVATWKPLKMSDHIIDLT
jgi:hypothetical protein